uniref:Uncharacterized protein n=2 Tax=Clastoptera arizonana TaxID=38151 RepID=A0A1B6DU94_9HEMI
MHMVPASVNDKYVIRFCPVAQSATDEDVEIAWEIITEHASELLESLNVEKEKENADEVFELADRKRKENLAYKRSFFVRMVSDPKIYNPKIAKTLPGSRRHGSHVGDEDEEEDESSPENGVAINTPIASWISWPLAFLFQSLDDAGSKVPVRFRHLDTMVRLSARRESNTGTSPSLSPENQDSPNKSPRRSPVLNRKRGSSPCKFE